ncbi:MAG: hypothetical protein ACE5II_06045 [Anaerolineae bacterium]
MSWTRLRGRVREWGPMAFCALLSLGAFYLWVLYGASLSKVILLGVVLICPAVYFIVWLLGDNSRGGGQAISLGWKADVAGEQVTWPHQPAPLFPRRGSK